MVLSETMFQNERHVQDIAGLGNYKEAYQELKEFIEKRIQQRKEFEQLRINHILRNVDEIVQNEQMCIANGKMFREPSDVNSMQLGDDKIIMLNLQNFE